MSLDKLYKIIDGGDLSPEDCREINACLAKIDIGDIPDTQIENVRDYLLLSLNMNSVELEIKNTLEELLHKLEAYISNTK